jgi:hypothetical protein
MEIYLHETYIPESEDYYNGYDTSDFESGYYKFITIITDNLIYNKNILLHKISLLLKNDLETWHLF